MSATRHTVTAVHGDQRVRVTIGDRVVAETRRPLLVHETGLPVRYHVPRADVDMTLLEPTATHTTCPYKGTASYWAFHDERGPVADVAWEYPEPLPGVAAIRDYLSFYDAHADIQVLPD
ncbi:DUF427 domain-containing protein [Streptomyces sp. 8K308]|uniref:DUF427 domain-containing protein n=1 Tax=Streptomyces sp. 8K308 TaxID=2530388 RepID=UPI00104BAC06|nr:DUF427 domain-containing protein [Streptomyces sp. 8K308]TDC10944.1 DUF427 domain-containing protein [Streptomyces sp. 8K308]